MELCESDPKDINNPFEFAQCCLNLPMAINYDPSMPRVLLLRSDGKLASRKVTFVDNIHGLSRGVDAQDQCVRNPP